MVDFASHPSSDDHDPDTCVACRSMTRAKAMIILLTPTRDDDLNVEISAFFRCGVVLLGKMAGHNTVKNEGVFVKAYAAVGKAAFRAFGIKFIEKDHNG